jgi:predicted phosphodiesterase
LDKKETKNSRRDYLMAGATKFRFAAILIALVFTPGLAQDRPYVIHDTQPVILEGPYLVAPTEDGITVVWETDTDCHSRVEYGESNEMGRIAEVYPHGMLSVGTTHAIRLTGLTPGTSYHYKVASTRVVKLKAYWPEKGLTVESAVFRFRTPNSRSESVTFSFLADTQHEDVGRLNRNLDIVNWASIEFLVHGGDAFEAIENEEQLFRSFLRPITKRLAHTKPLVFVRGNHEMRGGFARHLYDYVPADTGEFYYAFDAGPVHFLALDSAENKDDDANVYSGLNRTEPYREKEFLWLQNHIETEPRIREAAFRVILIHAPNWGWVGGQSEKWTDLANRAGIDLMIAGHRHRYSWSPAGTEGRDYSVLVVGQDQAAHVEVSPTQIKVVVTDSNLQVVGEIEVSVRE